MQEQGLGNVGFRLSAISQKGPPTDEQAPLHILEPESALSDRVFHSQVRFGLTQRGKPIRGPPVGSGLSAFRPSCPILSFGLWRRRFSPIFPILIDLEAVTVC